MKWQRLRFDDVELLAKGQEQSWAARTYTSIKGQLGIDPVLQAWVEDVNHWLIRDWGHPLSIEFVPHPDTSNREKQRIAVLLRAQGLPGLAHYSSKLYAPGQGPTYLRGDRQHWADYYDGGEAVRIRGKLKQVIEDGKVDVTGLLKRHPHELTVLMATSDVTRAGELLIQNELAMLLSFAHAVYRDRHVYRGEHHV